MLSGPRQGRWRASPPSLAARPGDGEAAGAVFQPVVCQAHHVGGAIEQPRHHHFGGAALLGQVAQRGGHQVGVARSEEHTSELQSLMRISYAVFCLKKKKKKQRATHSTNKTKRE